MNLDLAQYRGDAQTLAFGLLAAVPVAVFAALLMIAIISGTRESHTEVEREEEPLTRRGKLAGAGIALAFIVPIVVGLSGYLPHSAELKAQACSRFEHLLAW